jgi:hypothetical protein
MATDAGRTQLTPTPRARSRDVAALTLALILAGVGALGALPARSGASDPLALLTWLALVAAPAGFFFGAGGHDLVRFGAVAPGAWMVVLALIDAPTERGFATPLWAALAWTGLFAGGAGLGRLFPGAAWRGAGLLLLLAALLAGLPGRAGIGARPWPPAAAARLLDLSPVALVCESAGVRDWMWRAEVYEPVGVDRFARRPYRGALAGPGTLVVGCLLALIGARRGRRAAAAP